MINISISALLTGTLFIVVVFIAVLVEAFLSHNDEEILNCSKNSCKSPLPRRKR